VARAGEELGLGFGAAIWVFECRMGCSNPAMRFERVRKGFGEDNGVADLYSAPCRKSNSAACSLGHRVPGISLGHHVVQRAERFVFRENIKQKYAYTPGPECKRSERSRFPGARGLRAFPVDVIRGAPGAVGPRSESN
jgi:hypothetical protein